MLESQRLAYLNALGIPQYVARLDIDGAPALPELRPEQIWPSSGVDVDTVKAVDEAKPQQPAAVEAPTPASQAPTPETGDQAPIVAAQEGQSTSTPVLDISKLGLEKDTVRATHKSQGVAAEIRFALAVVNVEASMRLVVELALVDAPGLSASEHRMLSDILQLLGYPQWLSEHGPQTFQWPIVNNPQIAKDRSAARDGLVGFLASTQALPKTVFLGATAASLLNQGELDPAAEMLQPLQLSGLDSAVLVLPSLNQMQDWKLKQRSWQQLQLFLR